MTERKYPQFTKEEARAVQDFLKTAPGLKILETLDIMIEEGNNLLQIKNSVGDKATPEAIGFACALKAEGVKVHMQVVEFLTDIGTDYVDED